MLIFTTIFPEMMNNKQLKEKRDRFDYWRFSKLSLYHKSVFPFSGLSIK